MNWYLDVIKKYAVFSGRARRKEFFMFVLFNFLVYLSFTITVFILLAILGIAFRDDAPIMQVVQVAGVVICLYYFAVLVPWLAVSVRRLHDTGHSGLYLLWLLIPLLGQVIVLIQFCTDGTPGTNQYGVNPKETI